MFTNIYVEIQIIDTDVIHLLKFTFKSQLMTYTNTSRCVFITQMIIGVVTDTPFKAVIFIHYMKNYHKLVVYWYWSVFRHREIEKFEMSSCKTQDYHVDLGYFEQ